MKLPLVPARLLVSAYLALFGSVSGAQDTLPGMPLPPPYCHPCAPTDGPPDSETSSQGSLSLVVATEGADCTQVLVGSWDWDCEPTEDCQAHFVMDWTLVVSGGVGFCQTYPPCPPAPMTYMSSGSLEHVAGIPCGSQADFTGYTTGLRPDLSVSTWASCGTCTESSVPPPGGGG